MTGGPANWWTEWEISRGAVQIYEIQFDFGGIKENENEVCEETILKTLIETELKVEDTQDMTFVNV